MKLPQFNQNMNMRVKTYLYIVFLVLNIFNVFNIYALYSVFVALFILSFLVDIYLMKTDHSKESSVALNKKKYDLVESMISYSILFVAIIVVLGLFVGTMYKIYPSLLYSLGQGIFVLFFIGIHVYVLVIEIIRIKVKSARFRLETTKMRMHLYQVLVIFYQVLFFYMYLMTFAYRTEIHQSLLSLFIIFPPFLTITIYGLYLQKRNDYILLTNEQEEGEN